MKRQTDIWIRSLTLVLLSFVIQFAWAQSTGDPDLQSLVQAEEAFSKMAREKNTRDAFLFFLADDAITSARGSGLRQGKKHLEEQSLNESLLSWKPAFSDIAFSGDFGYNTGPWEFRQTRSDEQPVAYGQFVSMWKKDERGDWKVALDIGISHGKPTKTYTLKTSSLKAYRAGSHQTGDQAILFDLEKQFTRSLEERGADAYSGLLSEEAKFFRPGYEPYTTKDEVRQLLKNSKVKIIPEFLCGDMAGSGDLAFVYGKAVVESIKNDVPHSSQHSYLRFWKKENMHWKIVLDLLSD